MAGWLFLDYVSRGKWEAGMSGCPAEVLLVPALLHEATWTGGCRTSRIYRYLLVDLWYLAAPVKFSGRWAPAEEFAGQAALAEPITAFPST